MRGLEVRPPEAAPRPGGAAGPYATGPTPWLVDQPEDDLDNRFITDGVVPIVRQEKRRRQFVFSTHNANIPVLGDAELIVGLTAAGEAKNVALV